MNCIPCCICWPFGTKSLTEDDTIPLKKINAQPRSSGTVNDVLTIVNNDSQGSKNMTQGSSQSIVASVKSQNGNQRKIIVAGLIKQGYSEVRHTFEYRLDEVESGIEVFSMKNAKKIGLAANLTFADFEKV